MRRDLQPYEQKRRLPTLLLAIVLWLPWLTAMEIDQSAWRTTAPPLAVAAALVGVGIGLYTLMFLLLFYRLPLWIKARAGTEVARRWQYAALLAGMATGPITVTIVVPRLFRASLDLGLGLAMLAAIVVFTLLLWLMVRHFPEACRWGRR